MIARQMNRFLSSAAMVLVALTPVSAAWAKDKPVSAEAIETALAQGGAQQTLAMAESAVAANPRDGALRAALGRVYLKEGRFVSAAVALGDAASLGETSSRTLLALALAQVAAGQPRAAIETLDMGRNTIPAADLGLALALAGESARGTTILGDALRAGDKSDKLRANLAYAYALDGRWAEARNLVSLDLSPDKVDERMTQWAKAAAPEAARERVASLLGVEIKADGGLPSRLALAPVAADAPQLASAGAPSDMGNAPALAAAPEPVPSGMTAEQPAELPAVAPAPAEPAEPAAAPIAFAAVAPEAAQSAPMLAPHSASAAAHKMPAKTRIAHAQKNAGKKHAAKKHSAAPISAEPAAPAVAPAADMATAEAASAEPKMAAGHHMVQLGAFLSEKNATKARAQALHRDKDLRPEDVTIAKANVGGRQFWRVMVAGLDAQGALGKCQAIRKAGGACFARSDAAAQPKLATKKPAAPARKPKALAMAGAH